MTPHDVKPRTLTWRNTTQQWLIQLFAMFLLLSATTSRPMAQETSWVDPGVSTWFGPTNWDNGIPTPRGNAVIDNGGTSQIESAVAETIGLVVGDMSTGNLEIRDGGTLLFRTSTSSGIIGREADASGLVTVSGEGSYWDYSEYLTVGDKGNGEFRIENSGTALTTETTIARASGSTGSVVVTGESSHFHANDQLVIGDEGRGEFLVTMGGIVTSQNSAVILGRETGGIGRVRIEGQSSSWDNTAGLVVGDSGVGELTIANGGFLETGGASFNDTYIGRGVGSQGKIEVTGGGSYLEMTDLLFVGNSGEGLLAVDAGAEVKARSTFVGVTSDGTGRITVSQGGDISSFLMIVGQEGSGELTVSGGTATASGRAVAAEETDSRGHITISGSQSELIFERELVVGDRGEGELTISEGGMAFGGVKGEDSIFGNQMGSHGSVKVTGPGSQLDTEGNFRLYIGFAGDADLLVEDEGTVISSGVLLAGTEESTGKAVVRDEGSVWHTTGLAVGDAGYGELTISGGGSVFNEGARVGVGNSSTGMGRVEVSGEGSLLNSDATFFNVGDGGSGEMIIAEGGEVFAGQNATIAWGFVQGKVIVTGDQSLWTIAEDLEVARSGTAELFITNGGRVENGRSRLGRSNDGKGTVVVAGENSTWVSKAELSVGFLSEGFVTVENQASASSLAGIIGDDEEGFGDVTVTGAGSKWTIASSLKVGNAGEGRLTIGNGGFVSNTLGTIGDLSDSTGSVLVSGDNSHWQNFSSLEIGVLGAGKLTIEDGGFVSAASVDLSDSGQLFLTSGGTLATDGTLMNFGMVELATNASLSASKVTNYGMLTNSGTLSADIEVVSGGIVSGSGVFNGQVVIGDGGVFSPGSSPGFSETQITTWNAGGAYQWEINSLANEGGVEGNDPGWDLWSTGQLDIAGSFVIALATLNASGDSAMLPGWNSLESYHWRIATSSNNAFETIDDLFLDSSGFQNQLGGGSLWLSASGDGSNLFLNFTPVPEPSSLFLGIVGLLTLCYRIRKRR